MVNHLKMAKLIGGLLDNKFRFLGFKFGLDPLLGLIPGAGDAVSIGLSLYILWVGRKMGINQKDMTRMVKNVLMDTIIGSLPVAGDVFDFFFKANVKNLEILNKYDREVIEGEIVKEDGDG